MKESILLLIVTLIALLCFGVSLPMAILYGFVSVLVWYIVSPFALLVTVTYLP
ncbi:hypothetical protein MOA67_gp260 [Klebsiella phage KpLz-2_45]|uniref:hypothetical protein n=1 Tax=Klebsiella phage KpLz-2_45 TaxID=2698923 RepID=UPI001F1481E6|nr:hypothetical protein MOA67_gp260 [Klebsiella phage KpLz-2_45]UKS72163.1 hypothetical protein KpLz245_2970 [Klebsiella phage KpLz-2_45]